MEEYLDILNNDGTLAGYTASKKEAHEKGLWHKTVHVWCVNSKGEILLQHRSKEKENHPDLWDISVAGHVSSGESSIDGVKREVKEEIGLDISISDLEYLGTVHQRFVLNNDTYIDNELNDIYILKLKDDEKFEIQKEELDQLKWVTLPDLKRMMKENKDDFVPHDEEYKILFNYLENLK